MSVHEQFAGDLALYALGALEGDERRGLEQHLQSCADCRRELELLRRDTALLALSVSGPKPPQRARGRLLQAVKREPKYKPPRQRTIWWPAALWTLTAASVACAFFFWRSNSELRRQVASLFNSSAQQQAELRQAREVVETLTAADAVHVTLVAAKGPPHPEGKAIYMRSHSSLIFMASNMPKLPPQMAYELWLIPMKGAPIPAGMFKPDAKGGGMLIDPPLPLEVEAKAFAITVEPEVGSNAPTSPIIMEGTAD